MKKVLAVLAALLIVSAPLTISYAGSGQYQENVLDQAGDWFATLGKQGVEKDRILAERKAERLAKYAEKQAKAAGKEAEKAGKDMKKKLGL